jgi:hypothetical protein
MKDLLLSLIDSIHSIVLDGEGFTDKNQIKEILESISNNDVFVKTPWSVFDYYDLVSDTQRARISVYNKVA